MRDHTCAKCGHEMTFGKTETPADTIRIECGVPCPKCFAAYLRERIPMMQPNYEGPT